MKRLTPVMHDLFDIEGHDEMQKEKPQFQAIPTDAGKHWNEFKRASLR